MKSSSKDQAVLPSAEPVFNHMVFAVTDEDDATLPQDYTRVAGQCAEPTPNGSVIINLPPREAFATYQQDSGLNGKEFLRYATERGNRAGIKAARALVREQTRIPEFYRRKNVAFVFMGDLVQDEYGRESVPMVCSNGNKWNFRWYTLGSGGKNWGGLYLMEVCLNETSLGCDISGQLMERRIGEGVVVELPALPAFVGSDHFTYDNSPDGVNIGQMDPCNFWDYFRLKVEPAVPPSSLRIQPVCGPLKLDEIIEHLDPTRVETTLRQLWELVRRQPNGEDGLLLTNGGDNIACVRGTDNQRWNIHFFWQVDRADHGWYFGASLGTSWENRPEAEAQIISLA